MIVTSFRFLMEKGIVNFAHDASNNLGHTQKRRSYKRRQEKKALVKKAPGKKETVKKAPSKGKAPHKEKAPSKVGALNFETQYLRFRKS